MNINCEYQIKEDIGFFIEAEKINKLELSELTKISRTTLNAIEKRGTATDEVCEKLYSYIYKRKYRMNSVKEELIREKYGNVLFHGSKYGLSDISVSSSRKNCDFGRGFYLGQTYKQALSFVCEYDKASVYSFRYSLEGLECVEFDCSLDWMIAICYFRGTIREYAQSRIVQNVVKKIENADVIIAPIADNKMFYIMSQFAEGEYDFVEVKIDKVRLSSGVIEEYEDPIKHRTKNKKKRRIPLNLFSCLVYIEDWWNECGQPDYSTRIFDWTDSNARTMIQKACEMKGIQKHSCHDFRHTFISNLMADPTVSLGANGKRLFLLPENRYR